jgi:glutamine amidotransferase
MKVGVIDYGVGNLASVKRALEEIRVTPVLVERPQDMRDVDSLILPGVGNFSDCIKQINAGGWTEALVDQVQGYCKPLLGICLGMQLLATSSTEGAEKNKEIEIPGLNFIPGRVNSLSSMGCGLRIPHVGWNSVAIHSIQSGGLFRSIPNDTDFYFAHSYAFSPDNLEHVLATTNYDIKVVSAVRNGHIWGTQFHPEKSSRAGFQLLSNFVDNPIC